MIRAFIRRLLKPMVVVALMGLIASGSGSVVGADENTEITWQIEIKVTFTPDQTQKPGWEESNRALQSALSTRLQVNGTRLTTSRAANARGTELTLRAEGRGTATQFRRVAFDDLSPVGGLVGGPTMLTLNGAVKRGENLSLVLESNPSTGYLWAVNQTDAALLNPVGQSQFQQTASRLGAPAKQTIQLNAAQDGNARLGLVYRRAWETTAPTRRVTLSAPRLALLADITNPRVSAAAQSAPPNLPVRAPQNVGALPTHFNWASTDNPKGAPQVTAIRDQGACNSCWAFATVAPFESNLLIKDDNSTDLSEQYLVSCNTQVPKWNCTYGGWWAHDYHEWKTVPKDAVAGAVLESEFPYQAADVACNAPYSHPYRVNDWYYVGGQNSVPSIDAIKNTIYTYGPVAAAVCAGKHFSGYSGGVFTDPDGTDCGSVGGINHGIVLVGWDDATGTWVLRNSWGPWWGESGYMRIAYGTSQVGYGASYVVYNGAPICYSLTTAANPASGGGVRASPAPNCNGTQYTPGTVVTVTAFPSCGRTFLNWSGDLSGSPNPTTITLDAPKSITANFSASSAPCNYYLPLIQKSQDTIGWTTILSEDFEGAFPGGWATFGMDGYTWGKRSCRAYAGSYSGWGVGGGAIGATSSCGTNYPTNAGSRMVYGPFSLIGATAADVKFKLWLNTEANYDFVCRLASLDGSYFDGVCTSGSTSGGWIDRTLDLANAPGFGNLLGQPNVWIALEFYSDGSVNYSEGGFVDSLVLRKCPTGAVCPISASPLASPGNQTSEIPFRLMRRSK